MGGRSERVGEGEGVDDRNRGEGRESEEREVKGEKWSGGGGRGREGEMGNRRNEKAEMGDLEEKDRSGVWMKEKNGKMVTDLYSWTRW